jgi:hypothetical protein
VLLVVLVLDVLKLLDEVEDIVVIVVSVLVGRRSRMLYRETARITTLLLVMEAPVDAPPQDSASGSWATSVTERQAEL